MRLGCEPEGVCIFLLLLKFNAIQDFTLRAFAPNTLKIEMLIYMYNLN